MCNYAFEEPEQVIQNGYMYEENGVLYCASGTQKGVYCYTYCLNNPLHYTDPSGNGFVEALLNFLFIPARLGSEAFTWIDDKMNGYTRPNGYFNMSYLMGQTEPGGYFKYNPVNAVSYGQPGYIPIGTWFAGISFGTGWAMGADNQWFDIIYGFGSNLKAPVRRRTSAAALRSTASKLGITLGEPIPAANRNSAFVAKAKSKWFKNALSPSGGYIVKKLGDHIGEVIPNIANGLLTGGSTLCLDTDLAFTSPEQLFKSLGHELVHVEQVAALAGIRHSLYKQTLFQDMLDYYAYSYSNMLGGDRTEIFSNDYIQKMMNTYSNYFWSTNWQNFSLPLRDAFFYPF